MKLHNIIILLGLSALSFAACDEHEVGERWDDPITTVAKKNVLLEDFTGQDCSNCPRAAEQAHQLQQTFGADRVVVVALHGGPLSSSVETDEAGLATPESRDYNTRYMGSNSYPMGSVDRGAVQAYSTWPAAVASRMQVQPKVNLSFEGEGVTYDAEAKQISLNVKVRANEAVKGNLQVWLTESGVTAWQVLPTAPWYTDTYEHNHVFRATLNGMDGDAFTLDAEQEVEKEYTYTLPDLSTWKNQTPWQPTKLSIVVFFYNATDGVMQVVDHAVVG